MNEPKVNKFLLEPASRPALPWTPDGPLLPYSQPRVTRPLQFADLERMDEEVERAMRYAGEVEGLSPKTLKWWATGYRQFRRYLYESKLDRAFVRGEPDAQARALEGWIAWMRNHGSQHGTVRAHWCAVFSLFDRFTKLDGIWNPLRSFRRPRAAPPVPRAIAREDAERLLTYLRNARGRRFLIGRNLAIVACMLLAGLRRGELLRIELADIDHASRTIRVRRSKGRDGGKSRTAYMPQQLNAILRAYEREREQAGRGADKVYFISERTSGPLADGAIRRLFSTIYKHTGLRISPHMLRHTFVTLLRQAGVADRVTMDLAGHSTLAMTQRYSSVFSGEHLAAADQLLLEF
jgi:site-specific recombinase XerD